MAIPAHLLRSFLPVLVSAGLVLVVACSGDPNAPSTGQIDEPTTGEGGGSSASGATAGKDSGAEASVDDPPLGDGGAADDAPGAGGTPATEHEDPEPIGGAGGAGSEEPEPSEPTAGFWRGKALVEANLCVNCHQTDFGGIGVFANISPDDATGIGTWTDEEISNAVRKGVNKDGVALCAMMAPLPTLGDDQMADMVEFLRGIPPVSRKISSRCAN